MPTKPELETCIAELESLITDLLNDRDMQKKRADEWQVLAERRQDTISDYRRYLQKELKQTSKPHYTKHKGNKNRADVRMVQGIPKGRFWQRGITDKCSLQSKTPQAHQD